MAKFLEYKGHPLRRKDNLIYFGSMAEKYIVMLYSYNAKRGETLAEYYYRTNNHLLGEIKIAEYNPETNELRVISEAV